MMKDQRQVAVKIEKGPSEGGPFHEAWATARLPFIRAFWRGRTGWLLHRGAIHVRPWRNPLHIKLLVFIVWFLAIVLALWLIRAIVTVALVYHRSVTHNGADIGWYWGPFNPDLTCAQASTSCGAINSVLTPALLVAASTVIFLAWRLFRVRRFYKQEATTDANRLVQTASVLMDEVVGRDHLCDALMNNLRDRKTRRPHVIVGGVDTGKTALLVRLVERLAAIGAVPVPVRLRDVQEEKDLDFSNLAHKRFSEIVEPIVRSNAEQNRTWRWLREQTGRVVVLADGLEEALCDASIVGQRDDLIRAAIRKANEQELPLVITSRPHDTLRAMREAAITWLEPLSDEAALRYISRSGSWRSDPTVLDRAVKAAKVVESPLYLQIAKNLHSKGRLEPLWAEVNAGDLAVQDKWTFRQDLLRAWLDLVVDGQIHPQLRIDADTRQAVVEYVSALACIGLASGSATVALRDLDPFLETEKKRKDDRGDKRLPVNPEWRDYVARYLGMQMTYLQQAPGVDVRLAATWGAQLGLVQASGTTDPKTGGTVHFQHSIIQAYLGSRFLPAILTAPAGESPATRHGPSVASGTSRSSSQVIPPGRPRKTPAGILSEALPGSGRELLIAFMLYSRSLDGRCTCAVPGRAAGQPCPTDIMRVVLTDAASRLLNAANKALVRAYLPVHEALTDRRSFDMQAGLSLRALEFFGAAAEIASKDDRPSLGEIARKVRDMWRYIGVGEDPIRLREAKITVIQQYGAAARRVARKHRDVSTYRAMFEIGCIEPDYYVRCAIAEQVGTGAMDAFEALRDLTSDRVNIVETDRPLERAKGRPINQTVGDEKPPRFQDDRYLNAWLQRRQRQQKRDERKRADVEAQREKRLLYQNSMRAWLLPMLVDSAAMIDHRGNPWNDLEDWISYATKGTKLRRAVQGPGKVSLAKGERDGLGLALAQGFKYAANRRLTPQPNQEGQEFLIKQTREFLITQAEELLKKSTFWCTRLTLLQALTLWALPQDVTGPHHMRGSRADPKRQVREWLTLPKGSERAPAREGGRKIGRSRPPNTAP
jgi:hypothetical protein